MKLSEIMVLNFFLLPFIRHRNVKNIFLKILVSYENSRFPLLMRIFYISFYYNIITRYNYDLHVYFCHLTNVVIDIRHISSDRVTIT